MPQSVARSQRLAQNVGVLKKYNGREPNTFHICTAMVSVRCCPAIH
jgi:hypothetical protein